MLQRADTPTQGAPSYQAPTPGDPVQAGTGWHGTAGRELHARHTHGRIIPDTRTHIHTTPAGRPQPCSEPVTAATQMYHMHVHVQRDKYARGLPHTITHCWRSRTHIRV